MSRAKTAFALLVVFFAGCAASRILVVPPARAGTSPQRWEYACATEFPSSVDASGEFGRVANKFGAEGWELVSVTGVGSNGSSELLCFKRPLP